jgi:hypothetical protein
MEYHFSRCRGFGETISTSEKEKMNYLQSAIINNHPVEKSVSLSSDFV